MDRHTLHTVVTRFRAIFLATFPALTAQDLRMILQGPPETLLDRLQARYGYTRAEAKAAWNDFVLAHVDGRDPDEPHAARSRHRGPPRRGLNPALLTGYALDPGVWRLMRLGWGGPAARGDARLGRCAPRARRDH